jgi:hypothetical protein
MRSCQAIATASWIPPITSQSFQVIASGTDGEAQIRADRLIATSGYPGTEVWDRDRMVFRAGKFGDCTIPHAP